MDAQATPLVSVEGLSVRDGGRVLLDHVDVAIHPGEIVTVIGPNGAGKTTLLRAIIGAVTPSAGRVRRAKGLRIGYTPQKLAIERTVPITVERFLSVGAKIGPGDLSCALERAGVTQMRNAQMADLSGGELQRALLARALMRNPNLLILDEPTQGLDQPGEAGFYRLIEEIHAETGCAILIVSHDIHVVMRAADKVICLNGHVCCAGEPAAVSTDPSYLRLFGGRADATLALYRHHHDHSHDHDHRLCAHDHHEETPAP
jgi:zinc transport system ATP-binding protein